jgi:hypothetical protein
MEVNVPKLPQRLFLTRVDLKNLSLDLFLALQSLSAVRHLPSPNGREVLLSDLLRFSSTYLGRCRG